MLLITDQIAITTDKSRFEELLRGSKSAIERFVYYKIKFKEDAKDIIQDVYMTAFQKIDSLKDESNFKAWVIRIAQNKCNDYYKVLCRLLAESHVEGDIRKFFTFLDSDVFLPNWDFGEDNCGNETNLFPKVRIIRNGAEITCDKAPDMLDVVGRYTVEIAGKSYDTMCVMDIEFYNSGVATEQFIDKSGRTILWRRFNHDDWAYNRYKQMWSKKLPNNERITINGETYVHWYDCITDYIL